MKQIIDGVEKTKSEFRTELVLSGNITYVGKAILGSITSDPVWQIKKIDETSGISITWADSDSNFDNIMSDCQSLNYS